MLRTGLIAKKVGMTRLFMEDGKQIPVTVLALENLQVVAQRTADTNGYTAVQLGAGNAKAKRTSKAMRGHFAAAKVEPKRKVAEFRVAPENMINAGAAGVHFEDQLASAKKCGHLGGKVLVPTQEFITKLIAARLAAASGKTVCAVAGIHQDDATREEIMAIVANVERACDRLVKSFD